MFNIKKNSSKISFIGFFFIFLVIYLCLISIDWSIKVYVNLNTFKVNPEASLIEKSNNKNRKQLAKIKRSEDYKPLFYPRYFNRTNEYHSLYKKYLTIPLGAKPNTKYYVCDEGYGLTTFTSDKFGFWNSNEIYKKKIDLMIIGDSLAMNGCLPENKTFIGLLKNNLNVVNLSMGSNDPVHYAATAEAFISHLKPKTVIMIFTRGDFIDHYSQHIHIYQKVFLNQNKNYFDNSRDLNDLPYKLDANLLKLLNEAQNLTQDNIGKYDQLNPVKKPNVLKRILIMLSTHYKLTYTLNILFSKNYLPYGNKLAINVLNDNCQKHSCKGVVIYVPGSNFWRPDSRQKKHTVLLENYINNLQNLKFLDLTDKLINFPRKGYSPKGGHLSIFGNGIVFEEIMNSNHF